MFFSKKMSVKDKMNFLEYLAFQLKTKSSFEKAATRYTSNGIKRSEAVNESCQQVINDIRAGNTPANALYHAGFLEENEYSLIKNSGNSDSIDSSLSLIVELKKTSLKSGDILKKSVNVGMLVFIGVLSLIPIFKDQIVSLYQMFADMASMASGKKEELQLPFFVKHWWAMYILFAVVGVFYIGFKKTLAWLYEHEGDIYYKLFRYKIYIDLATILEILRQMTRNMSMNNAYRILSTTAPTQYWRNFFNEISEHLKHGGKASEIFSANRAIPLDVIYSLADAEDTGEVDSYLKKARDFCVEKNNSFQDSVRVGVPMFFELLIFFLVGLIVVKFIGDMNNLGIMNVILQVGK